MSWAKDDLLATMWQQNDNHHSPPPPFLPSPAFSLHTANNKAFPSAYVACAACPDRSWRQKQGDHVTCSG